MLYQFPYPSWTPNNNCHWIQLYNCYWLKDGEDSWYCYYEFEDIININISKSLPEFKFFILSGIMKEMYYSTSKTVYNTETDDDKLFYRIVKGK